eukprot:2420-Eustigmatos_ZCMA.PRE.1
MVCLYEAQVSVCCLRPLIRLPHVSVCAPPLQRWNGQECSVTHPTLMLSVGVGLTGCAGTLHGVPLHRRAPRALFQPQA